MCILQQQQLHGFIYSSTPMEGCSSLSPWTDIYEEADLRTPTFMDSCRVISRNDEEISWSDGGPNQHHGGNLPAMMMDPTPVAVVGADNMIQPFDASKGCDASSSIDQSLECLLSGTNSNTETSDEDDCISMLFNSDCSRNFWNFSSIDNQNTVISPGEIIIRSSNNDNNNNNNNNPRKRSRDDDIHDFHEDQSQQLFNLTASTSPPKGTKRRQSFNTVTSSSHAKTTEKKSKSSNISFQLQGKSSINSIHEPDTEAIQQMKEMIYRAAAFRPVNFGVEPIERPKRKNVRISNDPQTAAARQRRERISERLRALQKIVPGGSKMDTASMLDEAANYLKFLRNQVKDLESFGDIKLHQFYFTTSNHLFTPTPPPPTITTNLQFSPMSFPMQPPQLLPLNPNLSQVPKS